MNPGVLVKLPRGNVFEPESQGCKASVLTPVLFLRSHHNCFNSPIQLSDAFSVPDINQCPGFTKNRYD